jgi:hypothetical protein
MNQRLLANPEARRSFSSINLRALNPPGCHGLLVIVLLSATFFTGCASNREPPNQHLAPGDFQKLYPREYMRSLPPQESEEYERRLNQ